MIYNGIMKVIFWNFYVEYYVFMIYWKLIYYIYQLQKWIQFNFAPLIELKDTKCCKLASLNEFILRNTDYKSYKDYKNLALISNVTVILVHTIKTILYSCHIQEQNLAGARAPTFVRKLWLQIQPTAFCCFTLKLSFHQK